MHYISYNETVRLDPKARKFAQTHYCMEFHKNLYIITRMVSYLLVIRIAFSTVHCVHMANDTGTRYKLSTTEFTNDTLCFTILIVMEHNMSPERFFGCIPADTEFVFFLILWVKILNLRDCFNVYLTVCCNACMREIF